MATPSKLTFRQIADEVRSDIVTGRYEPASALPAEPVLAERFGVSRALINRAMSVLAAEGIVHPRQGRGTLVTWIPPLHHSPARYDRRTREQGGARGAFDAEILAIGLEPKHEITTEHASPPDDVADLLGLPRGEVSCVARRRRLSASGIPIRLNVTWIPLSIAAGTVLDQPGSVIVGGVKSALAELGYEQTSASERVLNRVPTEEEVARLEISPERSVYDITHVGRTAEGRAVEVTVMVTPAHYLIIETGDFALS